MDFTKIKTALQAEKREERAEKSRKAMRDYYSNRDKYLEQTIPWWQSVIEGIRLGGGYLVPSERYMGEDMTGSYIHPVWRRYSGTIRSCKDLAVKQERIYKMLHAEGAKIETLAIEAQDETHQWHDYQDAEEAIMDYLRTYKKADGTDAYRKHKNSEADEARHAVEEMKERLANLEKAMIEQIAKKYNAFLAAATNAKELRSIMGALASDKCLSVKHQYYYARRVDFVETMLQKALAAGVSKQQLEAGLEVRDRKTDKWKGRGENANKVFVTWGWYLGEVAHNYAKYLIDGGKSMKETVDFWLKNGRKFPEEDEAAKAAENGGYVFTPDGMEAPAPAPKPFSFDPNETAEPAPTVAATGTDDDLPF